MKKILSNVRTLIVLFIVTVLTLGFYAYMLLRPISYGMEYRNVTEYDGGTFEGIITFKSDDTMINRNTNFDQELESFYYYKDGYVFFVMAQTREGYEAEVAEINEDFEKAIATPFYAAKINAFRQVFEGPDGYSTTYTCKDAITFTVIGGVVELLLIALTTSSFIFIKNTNAEEIKKWLVK